MTFDANDLGDRQYTLDAFDGAAAAQDRLVFECLADVEPVPVGWLWSGRLATCKVTLLSGEPGIGKSQIAADASARITTGDAWPDGGEPHSAASSYCPLRMALQILCDRA